MCANVLVSMIVCMYVFIYNSMYTYVYPLLIVIRWLIVFGMLINLIAYGMYLGVIPKTSKGAYL